MGSDGPVAVWVKRIRAATLCPAAAWRPPAAARCPPRTSLMVASQVFSWDSAYSMNWFIWSALGEKEWRCEAGVQGRRLRLAELPAALAELPAAPAAAHPRAWGP